MRLGSSWQAAGLVLPMLRRCLKCVMSLNDTSNAVHWLLILCLPFFYGLWQVHRKRTMTETCRFTVHFVARRLLR
jgi:hypothetical protein